MIKLFGPKLKAIVSKTCVYLPTVSKIAVYRTLFGLGIAMSLWTRRPFIEVLNVEYVLLLKNPLF